MFKAKTRNEEYRSPIIGLSRVIFGTLLPNIAFIGLLTHVPIGFGQPNIPEQVIEEVQSMSTSQQRALARQYGLQMPDLSQGSNIAPGPRPRIAEPGEPIEPVDGAMNTKIRQDEKGGNVPRFGQSLFDGDVSTFAPTDDAPVSESYRLGVGDELLVQLFGKENEIMELQIGRRGEINFPKLGAITLAGLTFEDATDLIKTRVSEQFIGVKTIVNMGRLRSINIFIVGEVAVPGAYSVSALTTISQALFQAGGLSDIGSLRRVEVLRNGERINIFDVYSLLLEGDTSRDIRLRSGDVVLVPPYSGEITITGEVKRPMRYEVIEGETIESVLKMAGGFTERAFPSRSTIVRRADLSGEATAKTMDLSLQINWEQPIFSGDKLSVPRAGISIENSVTLSGAVNRPGTYGWFEGMRLSDLITDFSSDLTRDADLSIGLVVRRDHNTSEISVFDFSPRSLIRSSESVANLELRELDEVIIFPRRTNVSESSSDVEESVGLDSRSRSELLVDLIGELRSQASSEIPEKIVSISGAIKYPGSYPLTSSRALTSLIRLAGGLKDSGFTDAIEVKRLESEANGAMNSVYFRVDLSPTQGRNETYLQSRDHVMVREISDWTSAQSVALEGEVKFPGKYYFIDGETINSVLERAGGITDDAGPEGAIFTRKAIAEFETKQAMEFADQLQKLHATRMLTEESPDQTVEEIDSIVESFRSIQGAGRLIIDMPGILAGESEVDFPLEDGDRLVIPRRSVTISVIGEVMRPSTHSFDESLTLDDYIGLSAGVTKRADSRGMYIIKANGSVMLAGQSLWTFSDPITISAGDTIVVPVNSQYKNSLSTWREITQVIYQSVVALAAVARL